jgi:hypothetical protein
MFPFSVSLLVIGGPFGTRQIDQAQRADPGRLVAPSDIIIPQAFGSRFDDL